MGERNVWEISFADIVLGERIAVGAFGEVLKGRWMHTDVAVKRLLTGDNNLEVCILGHLFFWTWLPGPTYSMNNTINVVTTGGRDACKRGGSFSTAPP